MRGSTSGLRTVANARVLVCLIVILVPGGCMFGRMNEPARRAIFFAHYEAVERGAAGIEPVHLLLGVIRSEPELARRIAAAAGYDEATLFVRLDGMSPRKPKRTPQPVEMPLSEQSSRVLTAARRQLSLELTPADIWVAIIKEGGSIATRLLRELGVTERIVREQEAARPAASR